MESTCACGSKLRFVAHVVLPLLECVSGHEASSDHGRNILLGLMLMGALGLSEGVEVQRARPLGLDAAENLIRAPEDTALRLSVTAVPVLTRRAPFVAVWARWAHQDATQAREDRSRVNMKCIGCAEWIARHNEPPHVLLIRIRTRWRHQSDLCVFAYSMVYVCLTTSGPADMFARLHTIIRRTQASACWPPPRRLRHALPDLVHLL